MMKNLSILIASLLISASSFAQCYPDRHNTTWHDAWISCVPSQNPNSVRGVGHWIQYDLGHLYILGEIQVWNINDPDHLNRGAQEVVIDYSTDGENWTEFGSFIFEQGNGSSIYEGHDLVDFESLEAEHLLFTIVSNYGGTCAGFSELFIGVEGVISSVDETLNENVCFDVQVFPNPHQDGFKARVTSECNELMDAQLFDATGRLIHSQSMGQVYGTQTIDFDQLALAPGVYYLNISQGEATGRYQVVKMK